MGKAKKLQTDESKSPSFYELEYKAGRPTPRAEREKNYKHRVSATCDHRETKISDGYITCKICDKKLNTLKEMKKMIKRLFCGHKKLEEFDDNYEICLKCNEKFKKKESGK